MRLKIKKKKTTLGKLPNGSLFLTEDKKTLGMKSEYYNKGGASESFIVDSGCMFWGGVTEPLDQLDTVVWEVDVIDKPVNIYAGELNTERIETYTQIAGEYNVELSTVRDIFCRGAEWGVKKSK